MTASGSMPPWHAASAEDALARLASSRLHGLTGPEAASRRAAIGGNALPAPQRPGPVRRLLRQLHNLLIYVLLAAAAITALLAHWVDAGVILGVVIVNAVIGFLQEGKAERALDAIRNMLPLQAQVLRDGRLRALPAADLVPGDVVFLAAGDKVPADLRLLDSRGLRIDEAALTGESLGADKQDAPVAAGAALGDRACMAYASTLVTHGQGTGLVVATGARTEVGRISAMLAGVGELSTPLLRQIAGFGRALTFATLALAGAAFVFGTLARGYPAADMFLAAVGLAVALIPEGLPAIITITLAIGVARMAKRNAIVRRLPAVEALGAVTVICTDKTGTLTRNEMHVSQVLLPSGRLDVSGAGYAPQGGFVERGLAVDPASRPDLLGLARAALLCNDAVLAEADDGWHISGDPTEGALVSMALKAGLDQDSERAGLPRQDVLPFDARHRVMATLHRAGAGGLLLVKGAPERVLPLCCREAGTGALSPAAWHARMDAAAAAGMRLLAVASRAAPAPAQPLRLDDIEAGGLTLLGVLGLADPPRDEAIAAVESCRSAGIKVKMITGDHVATARAIGQQLALSPAALRACTGAELAGDPATLAQQAASCDVFARASPEDKLRLVQALQAQGEVVAMTGDGVNDAPALKRADVGVAMGRKGTETAKEAAEIVLADDNFASIAAAVEEGRAVYDNIRKAIVFTLPTNGGEAGMVLVAILLGLTLPITPVQILWINMITSVTLSLTLAFEAPGPHVMLRPPRDPQAPVLSGFLVWRVVLVSALMVAGGAGLFLWELERGAALAVARTAAVNAIVAGEIAYLFNVRRLLAPSWSPGARAANPYVPPAVGGLLLFQAGFTYLPAAHQLFGSAAIGAGAWLRVAAFAAALHLVVECEKWLLRRQRGRTG